jgi:hypothetical protein
MPVRVRGLLFVLLGVGLFGAGLAVAALWRNTPPMVLAGTVIAGLALVPKGALELLTNRRWADNAQWVRITALIVGIPGFIAALGYGMYFAFHR